MSPQDSSEPLFPDGARFRIPEEASEGDDAPSVPLARALRNRFPELSWGDVRRLCMQSRVLVEGSLAPDSRRTVRSGLKIEILKPGQPPPREAAGPTVHIRFEDEHVVVVEKPAGLPMGHTDGEMNPAAAAKEDSVLSRLRVSLAQRGERDPDTPLIPAYRLDRELSGLLVYTRSPEDRHKMDHQVRRRQLERAFVVAVQGAPPEDAGAIGSSRSGGPDKGRDRTRRGRGEGQTHYEVMERLGKVTVMRCQVDRGRVNDVRIHLAEVGMPILGESLYLRGHAPSDIPTPRLVMHGEYLAFHHPTRQRRMVFDSRLPTELSSVLRGIGSRQVADTPRLKVPDWAQRPRGEGKVKSMKDLLEVAAEIPDWDGAGAPPGLERDVRVDPDGFFTVADDTPRRPRQSRPDGRGRPPAGRSGRGGPRSGSSERSGHGGPRSGSSERSERGGYSGPRSGSGDRSGPRSGSGERGGYSGPRSGSGDRSGPRSGSGVGGSERPALGVRGAGRPQRPALGVRGSERAGRPQRPALGVRGAGRPQRPALGLGGSERPGGARLQPGWPLEWPRRGRRRGPAEPQPPPQEGAGH